MNQAPQAAIAIRRIEADEARERAEAGLESFVEVRRPRPAGKPRARSNRRRYVGCASFLCSSLIRFSST